jgi:hypothetical protein
MTLNRACGIAIVATCIAWATLVPIAAGEARQQERTSLRTVEGTVVALSSLPAEGNLEVVAVALDTGGAEPRQLDLLLAPQQVLDEISFGLETGDRLRARIFVNDEGPVKVHKALNLTRGTMVRFRSLRQVPLWSTAGDWEGGDCRRQGAHGGGHGAGPGPRGGGGGPRR